MPTPSARDQATEVTAQEWERRKAFVGFTDEDARLLRELRPAAEACADEVVEGLYRHLVRFEETKAFFTDPTTLNRVRALQKHYFLALTQGEYGETYLANRLHVGRVHQRIDLPPRWYLGAYAIYQELAFPHVLRAFGADVAKAERAFLALLKLMTLDQDLAMTAYISAAEQELQKTNSELLQLTLELDDRVAARTAEVQAKSEEVRTMSQQLWQAAKLATMGELAASIAHELNNPLATVSLRVESLLADTAPGVSRRRELEVIEQETDRMGRLVETLLHFGRRGGQQISTLDVRDEIDKTLELMNYHLRNRRIRIVQEFAPDAPMVQADRQQLRQLFLNLFSNASDAMSQGGTLTIRVRPGEDDALDESRHVLIEIADSGAGIAPENLTKVMEPFFTTKPEGKGTGLGLAICRRIVQEHHGTFDISSVVGTGTTVRLRVPVSNRANGTFLTES